MISQLKLSIASAIVILFCLAIVNIGYAKISNNRVLKAHEHSYQMPTKAKAQAFLNIGNPRKVTRA